MGYLTLLNITWVWELSTHTRSHSGVTAAQQARPSPRVQACAAGEALQVRVRQLRSVKRLIINDLALAAAAAVLPGSADAINSAQWSSGPAAAVAVLA